MKQYLLLAGAALIGWGEPAFAAIDCAVPPSCEELGFTMTTSQCSEKTTLKCPFDRTKVFCHEDLSGGTPSPIPCQNGSYLYQDYLCYNQPPSGFALVGTVVDAKDRLVVSKNYKLTSTHEKAIEYCDNYDGGSGFGAGTWSLLTKAETSTINSNNMPHTLLVGEYQTRIWLQNGYASCFHDSCIAYSSSNPRDDTYARCVTRY